MSVVETLLVFAAAPLAVILLLAALVYLPAGRKRSRYRPGQPWEHEPVWYEPHPEHASAESHGEPKAIGSSVYPERPAISGDSHGAMTGATAAGPGAAGAGAAAAGAAGAGAAPAPAKVGPLGGARGTW